MTRTLATALLLIAALAGCGRSGPPRVTVREAAAVIPVTTTSSSTTTSTTLPPPPPSTTVPHNKGNTTSRSAARPAPSGGSARTYSWDVIAPLLTPCECSSGHCNGAYRGYFQFSYTTWRSAGGSGDPEAASYSEQYERGRWLYYNADPRGQWPTCYPRALAQLARR